MTKEFDIDPVMEPLREGLDYVDATATFAKFAEGMAVLNARLLVVEQLLAQQAEINAKLIIANQQLLSIVQGQDKKQASPGLILPDRLQ